MGTIDYFRLRFLQNVIDSENFGNFGLTISIASIHPFRGDLSAILASTSATGRNGRITCPGRKTISHPAKYHWWLPADWLCWTGPPWLPVNLRWISETCLVWHQISSPLCVWFPGVPAFWVLGFSIPAPISVKPLIKVFWSWIDRIEFWILWMINHPIQPLYSL